MTDLTGGTSRRTVLRSMGAGALTAAGALGTGGSAAADPADDHYHNPVGPVGFGDVTVIEDDGTYYAYGTETPYDIIPIGRSEDMVDWEYVTQALDSYPDWRDNEEAGVWAPDINYYDGQYHLYYSYSTWGSQNNPGIGLATADSPNGPFEDQGPVFREEDLGPTNAIDPDFNVVDGTPYLVWGSWYGIHGVQLTEAADDFVADTEFHLAGDHREGPMIVEENGYYYLFYSTGLCCRGYDSTYGVEVGRSETFEGPYRNQNGTDLRELDDHHSGVSVLSATERFTGPGHNTAYRGPDGNWWMLYHVEATAEEEVRTMMIDRIQWTDDDWPVVACNGHPSGSSPVPGDEFDCDGDSFESSLASASTPTAESATPSPTATATATPTDTALTATATATPTDTDSTPDEDGTGDATPEATDAGTATSSGDGAGMSVLTGAAALGASALGALAAHRRGGDGE